jgi:diguanylate cyclase (GGDEF)-like protein/PAS domain S-box-containing protein
MATPSLALPRRHSRISIRSWYPTLVGVPVWGGAITAAIGLVVLLGWTFGVDYLTSMLPGVLAMKANAALCFVLFGTGLALSARTTSTPRMRSFGRILLGSALAIAALTAAQYVSGLDFGIDQLLFRDRPGAVATVAPGRMSPLTASCFILVGLAALAPLKARWTIVILSGVAIGLAALNVFEFMFGAAVPSFLASYTRMALNTAVGMGVLAFAVIGRLGADNPFALLDGATPTASVFRRLYLASIAAPVLVAWLRLEGQRLGLYDTSYGTSLMLVGILTLGTVAILLSARWALGIEKRREALEYERDRFFEFSLDMLSVIDSDGIFRRVNAAWEAALGYRDDELIGRSFLEFLHPDDVERTAAEAARHYGEGAASVNFQNRYRHRDGSYRWLEWMSRTSADMSVAYGVARDVTDRKRRDDRKARRQRVLQIRNEALSKRAERDPLTGLHNRRFFDDEVARLERRWVRLAKDERPPVAVIMFDLDHFGEVNNQHGHQAGDAVLRSFSGMLRKRLRAPDLVARYGGEEFVAVLENATSADACRIAEDIRAEFERSSIDTGGVVPLRVTVSAGCAQLGDDRNTSAGLAMADVWLSQAKRTGRNQVIGL